MGQFSHRTLLRVLTYRKLTIAKLDPDLCQWLKGSQPQLRGSSGTNIQMFMYVYTCSYTCTYM